MEDLESKIKTYFMMAYHYDPFPYVYIYIYIIYIYNYYTYSFMYTYVYSSRTSSSETGRHWSVEHVELQNSKWIDGSNCFETSNKVSFF